MTDHDNVAIARDAKTQDRRDYVRRTWPDAEARKQGSVFYVRNTCDGATLGMGPTEFDAWDDAAYGDE